MSEASESTASDKPNRDQYLSEVKALYIESKAPLAQRDNRFFDSTLKLFRQAGKSSFDHRVWRESKMLPEMIMLHQKRYIGINPHESIEIQRRRHDLDFEDWIVLEQEVDDEGLSTINYLGGATTISMTYEREQLEIWAAEKWLNSHITDKAEEHDKNKPQPRNNYLTYQQLQEQIRETDPFASKGTIQKHAYRAIEKAHQKTQELPVQLGGLAKKYQLVKLGELMQDEKQPNVKQCLYQKINTSQ